MKQNRLPQEPVADSMGAGAHFEAVNKHLLAGVITAVFLYRAGTRHSRPACARVG